MPTKNVKQKVSFHPSVADNQSVRSASFSSDDTPLSVIQLQLNEGRCDSPMLGSQSTLTEETGAVEAIIKASDSQTYSSSPASQAATKETSEESTERSNEEVKKHEDSDETPLSKRSSFVDFHGFSERSSLVLPKVKPHHSLFDLCDSDVPMRRLNSAGDMRSQPNIKLAQRASTNASLRSSSLALNTKKPQFLNAGGSIFRKALRCYSATPPELESALFLFKEAEKSGHAGASYYLGLMHYNGNGNSK
jgi:TPR repeat protein